MGIVEVAAKKHTPRRRFGQNFLHDGAIIDRIIAAIDPRPGELLVEIGPGLGALTIPLLQSAQRLTAIELDRDLIAPLQSAAGSYGDLHVVQQDALTVDLAELRAVDDANRLRVVGNLPYNISTPLLFHLLDQVGHIADMHFMLQLEVARRIAAPPGDGAYGRLSVMIKYFCEADVLFTVAPGAFQPPPKVTSAIVRLVPHALSPVTTDPALLSALLVQAFSQRRKTLRNSLKAQLTAEQISAAGVDPGARPETLTLAQFCALAEFWQRPD